MVRAQREALPSSGTQSTQRHPAPAAYNHCTFQRTLNATWRWWTHFHAERFALIFAATRSHKSCWQSQVIRWVVTWADLLTEPLKILLGACRVFRNVLTCACACGVLQTWWFANQRQSQGCQGRTSALPLALLTSCTLMFCEQDGSRKGQYLSATDLKGLRSEFFGCV